MNRIIINKGSKAYIPLIILIQQEEGFYRYIPSSEDLCTFILRSFSGELIVEKEITSEDDELIIDFDTNISQGEYLADVKIKIEDDEYYAVYKQSIYIV